MIAKTILPKLIVILGPTASGKTDLAVKLAKRFNGEIISADSRQVYKYMPIGTDVPKGEWQDGLYLVKGVPHYLMDCLEPDKEFTMADFKNKAVDITQDIIKRGKVPLVVGGTGLYISALVDNFDIPKVKPDKELRVKLESKNLGELMEMLKQKDPLSAAVIDLNNPRRVIRALEVALTSGKSFVSQKTKSKPLFDVLQIGIKRKREEIYESINQRVEEQIKLGLVEEIKNLLDKGYGWELTAMSGLGYRQFKDYLAGKRSLGQAVEILKRDTRHYAKRQLTWFKRDKRIRWVPAGEDQKVISLVRDFLG